MSECYGWLIFLENFKKDGEKNWITLTLMPFEHLVRKLVPKHQMDGYCSLLYSFITLIPSYLVDIMTIIAIPLDLSRSIPLNLLPI